MQEGFQQNRTDKYFLIKKNVADVALKDFIEKW